MANNWSLKEIYKGFDDPAIEKDFKALEKKIEEMDKIVSNLKTDKDFEKSAIESEKMDKLFMKLASFASLSLSTNTQDKDASNMMNRIFTLGTKTATFAPTIANYVAKHKNVEKLIASSDYLREIAFPIRKMKKRSEHVLSGEMESVLSKLQIDGSHAWSDLFDLLTSTVEAELPSGKKVSLPVVRSMAHDPSEKVRKEAYEAEIKCYEKIEKSVAAALTSIKGEVITTAAERKYESPLDMTLEQTNMSKETLTALIDTIKKNLPMLQKYLRAKAEYMGSKKGLPFYNLYAHIGKGKTKKFTYEEAQKFVLDAFGTFSPALKKSAKNAFDKNWIDVEPKNGKVGGAFCHPLPYIGEFRVLTNFKGNFSDVLTLAHELGHGYHAIAAKDVNLHNLDYPMTLAETASTFCETIVYNKLLDETGDLDILESMLQDITAIIVDIYSRYLFESRVFEERKTHKPTADDYKEYMLQAQKEAYGKGLDPKVMHPYMWACKGHYYSAGLSFYNFPYSFGQLFATGLYNIFKKNPKDFIPKYDLLLQSAGAMSVEDACAIVGVDPTKHAFWQSSFDVYKELVDRFLEMTSPKAKTKKAAKTTAAPKKSCAARTCGTAVKKTGTKKTAAKKTGAKK